MRGGSDLRVGSFMRHRALGSEAVYEVIEAGEDVVTAAVVSAPGLPAGMEVRLAARDARAMEHVMPSRALGAVPARSRRRAA